MALDWTGLQTALQQYADVMNKKADRKAGMWQGLADAAGKALSTIGERKFAREEATAQRAHEKEMPTVEAEAGWAVRSKELEAEHGYDMKKMAEDYANQLGLDAAQHEDDISLIIEQARLDNEKMYDQQKIDAYMAALEEQIKRRLMEFQAELDAGAAEAAHGYRTEEIKTSGTEERTTQAQKGTSSQTDLEQAWESMLTTTWGMYRNMFITDETTGEILSPDPKYAEQLRRNMKNAITPDTSAADKAWFERRIDDYIEAGGPAPAITDGEAGEVPPNITEDETPLYRQLETLRANLAKTRESAAGAAGIRTAGMPGSSSLSGIGAVLSAKNAKTEQETEIDNLIAQLQLPGSDATILEAVKALLRKIGGSAPPSNTGLR